MRLRRIGSVLMVAVAVALFALPTAATGSASGSEPAALVAHGGATQVYATGLAAGDTVVLRDGAGDTVATDQVNALGGVLYRDVTPGDGYTLENLDTGDVSAPVMVHSDAAAPWDPTIYDQTIEPDGYQYLTTRDGTELAIMVRPPLAPTDGPVPTLIEYAGYGYADPDGPESGLAVLANAMGFAVVDVNMRGTGCSGGSFDFFEMQQNLDAYDVIETIANQPWVANNQVGMFGISFGGISQLFASQLNPPHLAAIAPLSVIDATAPTLYPGGILNTGFAVEWAKGRMKDAEVATATTGQRWAHKRITDGDEVCAANQALHPEAVDLLAKIRANSHYDPAVADPLDPVTFVHKIRTPVFLACQFQDEQTGGHCPELVRSFTGTDDKWFVFTNGAHIDALDPDTLNQVFDFLHLFVSEEAPGSQNALLRIAAPFIYQTALGVPDGVQVTLPTDPIQQETTYAGALAAFRALPRVQVRFDNGVGTAPDGTYLPGNPYAAYTLGFDSLPAPDTSVRTWYLGEGGTLTDAAPTTARADRYTSDASALALTDYTGDTGGGGLWSIADAWKWNWAQNPAGSAVAYVTEPLAEDTTVFGTGAATLWVRSSTPDVDVQVTVSEVRPDGVESFVQNGWLRASARKLSTGTDNIFKRPSTPADPIPSFLADDVEPMPAGEFAELAIPLFYQGHAYRAGSRIRVTVAAPNGTQPIWSFAETEPAGTTADVAIAHSPSMPSTLMLPVVEGAPVPTGLPECPSLRNEPCRAYEPLVNVSEELPDESTPEESTTTSTVTSTTVPDAATTTVAPSTDSSVSPPGASQGASPGTSGRLPVTGTTAGVLAVVAACLIVTGAVLARSTKRRRLS